MNDVLTNAEDRSAANMPIVIRHGQRFLTQLCYTGENFSVSRYERELDLASFMFVIDDNINDRAMQFIGQDAHAFGEELDRVGTGELSPVEFESKLKGYFDEAARRIGGRDHCIGTYTAPAPYRVFRVIQGGAQHSEPSPATVADGDSSSTDTKPPSP